MSYMAICDKLKAERIAADNLDMEHAKDVYGCHVTRTPCRPYLRYLRVGLLTFPYASW
jgi:hypothetical protein